MICRIFFFCLFCNLFLNQRFKFFAQFKFIKFLGWNLKNKKTKIQGTLTLVCYRPECGGILVAGRLPSKSPSNPFSLASGSLLPNGMDEGSMATHPQTSHHVIPWRERTHSLTCARSLRTTHPLQLLETYLYIGTKSDFLSLSHTQGWRE